MERNWERENSETEGWGLEAMGSHQRILNTVRQGHFWNGNFAAWRTDCKQRSWRQGQEMPAPRDSLHRKPQLDHRRGGGTLTFELLFYPLKGKLPPGVSPPFYS